MTYSHAFRAVFIFLLLGSDVKALFPLSFQVNRWLVPFRLTAENLTNIAFLNTTVYSHAP